MTIFALSTASQIDIGLAVGVVIWVVASAMTASYGYGKGYPFWALFISGLFLGFPLVLLVITIAAGPQRLQPVAPRQKSVPARSSEVMGP